ncbi:cutinase family protein [Mycobacterium sp. OTB74]|jgi:cutinase|uniref:cutinase family protein n=1 Tax=Mycobacterium sp. OTB74 TaxID=1853452 RepID=UPI002474573D|nr:cutinase family protein [Mycobacterium sp. OTB74]
MCVVVATIGPSPGVVRADDCADVELVFARGTAEPPGLGRVGQALAGELAPRLGGRTMTTYGVNYPASINFLTTADGANDATAHIAATAAQCPGTRIVLGGFSQGAAVVAMLAGVNPLGDTVGNLGSAPPLPPDLAARVNAVAVFGGPSARFGTPLSTTGLFAGRTIDLCAAGDPICEPGGRSRAAHNGYEFAPFPGQAAGFIAGLV